MSKSSHLQIGGAYFIYMVYIVEKSSAIKSVQRSVLHERKYNLSKIKVAFCTNFLWLPRKNLALFCTRAKRCQISTLEPSKNHAKSTAFFFKNLTFVGFLRFLFAAVIFIITSSSGSVFVSVVLISSSPLPSAFLGSLALFLARISP